MKKILVAGMHHESNSFNPIITTEKDFSVIYGEDIFLNIRENDSVSGIITTLQKEGYEVIPTVFARAVPNGEIDYDFYQKIKYEILKRALDAKKKYKIDAVTLSLHGSMRVKELGEAEGDILEALRGLFTDIPIFSSLDMHTTMTEKMHNNCDGFVGYKCAPHIDCTETGEHAAKMTIAALKEGFKAKSAWVRVPILVAGEQSSTTVYPMNKLIEELRECENKEGIAAASYLMGFPWADNEDSAVSVFVVADDEKLAQKEVIALAQNMWSKRNDFCFQTEAYSQLKALDVAFGALSDGKFPIYISDSGDNPTAGASSDCTDLLKLLIADDRTDLLKYSIIYGGIYDPYAVKLLEGQKGKEVTLTFGARFDTQTSTPITTTGIVKEYFKGWKYGIMKSDVVLFNSCGVDILLSSEHIGYTTPKLFEDLGVNPRDAQIVVCKLGYLTHKHSMIAKRSILALTKGNTNEDLKTLDYKKVQRPIFPLDDEFEYNPEQNIRIR